MPWFKVTQKRSFEESFVVEAKDEEDAVHGDGPIIEHEYNSHDSVLEEIISVEEVSDALTST